MLNLFNWTNGTSYLGEIFNMALPVYILIDIIKLKGLAEVTCSTAFSFIVTEGLSVILKKITTFLNLYDKFRHF